MWSKFPGVQLVPPRQTKKILIYFELIARNMHWVDELLSAEEIENRSGHDLVAARVQMIINRGQVNRFDRSPSAKGGRQIDEGDR